MKSVEAPEKASKKVSVRRLTKPRAYGGIDLAARAADRRKRLLQAGIRVIGQQGRAAATVKAVCAEAQLTERYFYESFDNSEALLLACYDQLIAELQQRVQAALLAHAHDPTARAQAALAAYFGCMRQPETARIVLLEILGVSATVDTRYRLAMDRFAEVLHGLAEPMFRSSQRPVDLHLLAHGLIGSVVNMGLHWYLSGYRLPEAQVVATAFTLFNALQNHAGSASD